MEVKNCKKCGKVFKDVIGRGICNNCSAVDQKDFKMVREYLFDHPNSTAIEVSEATGVRIKLILDYLRDGRLESPDFQTANEPADPKVPSIYTKSEDEDETPRWGVCPNCGFPVRNGQVCKNCS